MCGVHAQGWSTFAQECQAQKDTTKTFAPARDNAGVMYKILGNYQGNTQDEVIDEDFDTIGYARRMLMEYIMAFGRDWGRLWIVDQNGNKVY